MADSKAKQSYLFKILISEFPGFSNPIFSSYYEIQSFQNIIDAEIERKFVTSFYKNLSFSRFESYLNRLPFKAVKSKYQARINNFKVLLAQTKFEFTKPPKSEEISAEQFGAFGGQFNEQMTSIINNLSNIISRSDPNFTPYLLSEIVGRFKKETKNFKRFIPVSKDADLETAMNDELAKLHQFLDQKLIEYQQLYYASVEKTSTLSGARKYSQSLIDARRNFHIKGLGLWQN